MSIEILTQYSILDYGVSPLTHYVCDYNLLNRW